MAYLINKENRHIYINADIDNNVSNVILEILNFNMIDAKNEKEKKDYTRPPIKIYITSNGGYMSHMFALSDIMLMSDTEIHTYALGNISSAAVNIFLAGHKRYLTDNTYVLLHSPSVNFGYDYIDSLETEVEQQKINRKRFMNNLLEKTSITKKKLDEIMKSNKNYYPTKEELIKWKFGEFIDVYKKEKEEK